MFKPADYVLHHNSEFPEDISVLTDPIMEKFPTETAELLMSHYTLRYEDIRVGNKGACLIFYLLGICSDPHFSYRHMKANPKEKRTEKVKIKLESAIQSYVVEGVVYKQRKCPVTS